MKIFVTNEEGTPIRARVAVFAEVLNELTVNEEGIVVPESMTIAGTRGIVRVREYGWKPFEEVVPIVTGKEMHVILKEDRVVTAYHRKKSWVEKKITDVKKLWNSYGIGCPDED